MKKIFLLSILVWAFTYSISAQNAAEKIIASEATEIINKLWKAMRVKDGEAVKSLFLPGSQLVAIDKPRNGKGASKTRILSAVDFAKLVSETKSEYIEQMQYSDVRIFGDLAVISGRYTFHVGQKFSHCGTNTFNLARTQDGWKITNAASTLEFQCENDLKKLKSRIRQ